MYNNLIVNIEDNWYAPVKHLKELDGVVVAELWDTTSSAGDWSGYFIVKQGSRYELHTFSQENNWPRTGFTLYTSNTIASSSQKLTDDEISEVLNSL